ncbi:MAG: bi-domain-containing oxidoreductase [Candidatus Binatia bacterium]
MKQLLQDTGTGELRVEEVPLPALQPGAVVVRNHCSLVSAGTERATLNFVRRSLLGKAQSRPDLVRQVLDKAQQEGISTTLKAVRNRLDQPLAPGYSCAGTIIQVGDAIADFAVGDRVACAGAGYSVHAEVISVPRNLVVKLPDSVDFESAAFTTLGAIALHGVRLANIGLGETVAVIGLGLIGLLTIQVAKAAGAHVLGMDPNTGRCELAGRLGCDGTASSAEQMESLVNSYLSSSGADAVIIAADTSSSEPIELAGVIARERASVVAVGAVGMEIPRKIYYEKELTFRVSRSYGPGRYDSGYEEKGHDYPIGYVRWTENRNMQAFLRLLDENKVDVKPLITHRFPITEAPNAYDLFNSRSAESFLGVLITYSGQPDLSRKVSLRHPPFDQRTAPSPFVTVGLLGAGKFAITTLLPAMKKVPGIELIGVCSASGLTASHAGQKFGFQYCTTEENEVINRPEVNTVVIATRHHLHARQVLAALSAGKHVYCEKPLCLNEDELRWTVTALHIQPSSILTVGYNRRFAPMARQFKSFLAGVHEPLVMHYRVNAGYVQPDHWIHDPEQGGGRIIGEVCHFVDFLTFLAGASPMRVDARALSNGGRYRDDNVIITLEYTNGSLGIITYVASGDRTFPKERIEVFGGGAVGVMDDFRRLELVRNGRRKVRKARLGQDKGHRAAWEAFVTAVHKGGPPPLAYDEIVATTLTTFRILDALRVGEAVGVDSDTFITSAINQG